MPNTNQSTPLNLPADQTLVAKLLALATTAGTNIGGLAAQLTLVKSSLTGQIALEAADRATLTTALNALMAQVNAINLQSLIADGTVAATSTWSSAKINAAIIAEITKIQGGAPAAGDTLAELFNAIANDQTGLAGLLAVQAKTVRVDIDQTVGPTAFTQVERDRALNNLGAGKKLSLDSLDTAIGDIATCDPIAAFNGARTAALAA
jgi:hypothetical protein